MVESIVTLSPHLTLSYDNFFGNMSADTLPAQLRFYNDFIAQYNPSDRWQFAAAADIGFQSRSTQGDGTASWYGASAFAKYHVSRAIGVVARIERYADPSQVIVKTNLPYAFETNAASLGLDMSPAPRFLWRSELRMFGSSHPVWPGHARTSYTPDDGLAVTSLALTF